MDWVIFILRSPSSPLSPAELADALLFGVYSYVGSDWTGDVLFPGRDNNHMLKHIQDVRGPFSSKMLRKSMFRELHYTEELVFVSKEKDPVKKSFVFDEHPIVPPSGKIPRKSGVWRRILGHVLQYPGGVRIGHLRTRPQRALEESAR